MVANVYNENNKGHLEFIFMSEGIPYADIVIMALVAGFILLRLRSVLGQKIGNDSPDFLKKNIEPARDDEPVVKLADKARAMPRERAEEDIYLQGLKDGDIAKTLRAIKEKDEGFSATQFLQGAKMAFEMIFEGFAKGDKAPLKMLLSEELYKHFESEIDARVNSGNKTETTLVSVKAEDISRAILDKNAARLNVRFTSEQITVVRDTDGKIIEGDPSDVNEVADEWTFERDITSKNPNWKVIDN